MKLILQKKVRECCDVSLAWWHRVKWATKMIMCVFATDFIAPLFHEFFFSVNSALIKWDYHLRLVS